MKSAKRFSALLFSILTMFSLVFPANALDAEMIEIEAGTLIGEESLEPQYFVTCPSGKKHQMAPKGTGFVYYGTEGNSEYRFTGHTTQCTYCYLVLITENSPSSPYVTYWGNYATWQLSDPLNSISTTLYTTNISYSSSKTGYYEQGFEFLTV